MVMLTHRPDTVSRRSSHKKKQKQTQKPEVDEQTNEKENLKLQSVDFECHSGSEASQGLGMKGSKLLTRQRKWQLAHPDRRRAHELVRRALLKGELVKQPCEDCGTDQHVDAHHERYDQPLDVTWLCRQHHMRRHRRKIVKGPGVSQSLTASASSTGASPSRKGSTR